MEILIATAIFVIILLVVVVNFRSSNRQSELKFATDNLAGNLRYLQTLVLSNVKVNDYPGVERGYNYVFTANQPTFTWQEITSPAADSPLSSFTYNYLETKNFSYPEVSLIKIEYNAQVSFWDKLIKYLNPIPKALAVCPGGPGCGPTIMQSNFLFPEANMQLIWGYSTTDNLCGGQPCTNMILYLKHSSVNNRQGKVTISKLSGRITSEIVAYP